MRRSLHRAALCAVSCSCLLALAASPRLLHAEEDPNLEAQLRLNNEAAAAASEGDLERAILLLRSALELGELNVTWLNLGRTYAKAGQCASAAEAYGHVAAAPAVEAPPAAEITALAEQYRDDLATKCYATVTFDCRPSEMTLVIDGGEAIPCPQRPLPLEPGVYQVVASLGEQKVETEVEVAHGERTRATVVMPVQAPAPPPEVVLPPEPPSAVERPLWWGVGLAGVGVSLVTAAVVIDQVMLPDEIDALERLAASGDADGFAEQKDTVDTLQGVNLGLFIGGGVVLAGGVTLVVLDLVLYGEPERDMAPTAAVSADGAQLGWRWRF